MAVYNIGPDGTGRNTEERNQKYRQDYKLGEDLKYKPTRIIVLKLRR